MRYVGKRLRREDKQERGLNVLLPSCLVMFACVVCLSGLTWAWFSATQSASIAAVQSAEYTVTTTVVDANQQPADLAALTANTTYTVTLTADGTASTGWCTVTWDDTAHYIQLAKDESITFTVIPTAATSLTVEYSWGKLPDGTTVIQPGEKFGEIVSDTPDADTPAEADDTETIILPEDDVSEPPADTPTDTDDETPAEDSPTDTSPDTSAPADNETEEDAPADDNMPADETATAGETLDI